MFEEGKRKNYVANDFSELIHLKGEKIKGVLQSDNKKYIIFESDFAFYWTNCGSYGIETPQNIRDIVKKKVIEAKNVLSELNTALEMVGEPPVKCSCSHEDCHTTKKYY
jgi:hypothetical protein